MRRIMSCLVLTAALAGCDPATDPVDPANIASGSASVAPAGTAVDPNTLIPVPPPGAVCRSDGIWTICHTESVFTALNQAVFDLSCGTVYETSTVDRQGIRWYNSDSKIVKRFVTEDGEGTWSLSPTGAEPTVKVTSHASFRNLYAVPGDMSTGPEIFHGEGTSQAPGFGVIHHIAGLDLPDGHHGIFHDIDDPAVAAELCAALTR